MNTADAEKIVKTLQAMMSYELGLSDLYRQCSGLWKSDAPFWLALADAETRHAAHIVKMAAILMKRPVPFEAGRPFNLQVLQTALAGLKDISNRLMQGHVPHEKMLIMARDIEQSILESRYTDIVKTSDVEYQTLMRAIVAETYEHRKALEEKIADMKRNV